MRAQATVLDNLAAMYDQAAPAGTTPAAPEPERGSAPGPNPGPKPPSLDKVKEQAMKLITKHGGKRDGIDAIIKAHAGVVAKFADIPVDKLAPILADIETALAEPAAATSADDL